MWTVNGSHPIARGVPHPIIVPEQEMYGEMFDIPAPDELVFVHEGHSAVVAVEVGPVEVGAVEVGPQHRRGPALAARARHDQGNPR